VNGYFNKEGTKNVERIDVGILLGKELTSWKNNIAA